MTIFELAFLFGLILISYMVGSFIAFYGGIIPGVGAGVLTFLLILFTLLPGLRPKRKKKGKNR